MRKTHTQAGGGARKLQWYMLFTYVLASCQAVTVATLTVTKPGRLLTSPPLHFSARLMSSVVMCCLFPCLIKCMAFYNTNIGKTNHPLSMHYPLTMGNLVITVLHFIGIISQNYFQWCSPTLLNHIFLMHTSACRKCNASSRVSILSACTSCRETTLDLPLGTAPSQ